MSYACKLPDRNAQKIARETPAVYRVRRDLADLLGFVGDRELRRLGRRHMHRERAADAVAVEVAARVDSEALRLARHAVLVRMRAVHGDAERLPRLDLPLRRVGGIL